MDHGISTRTEDYLRSNRKKVRWKRVVSLLSGIVMFCTTYTFILPAITMTPELICGQTEHVHDAECYEIAQSPPEAAPTLVCTLEEREAGGHTHDAACRETVETLACTLAEDEEHTHEDSCYETAETLICPLEEDLTEGHTHGEDCWAPADEELPEQEGEPALICGMEEHTHSTGCYNFPLEESGPTYYCGFHSEHTHDEGCRFESGELRCTLPEHTHSEACAEEPPVVTGPVTLSFEEETELFRTAWQVTLPKGIVGLSDAYSFTTELVDEEDDLVYAYTEAFVPQEDSVTLPIGVLRFRLTDGDGNEVDPARYTVSGVLVPSKMLVTYAAMMAENSPLTLDLDSETQPMESGSSALRLYRLAEGGLETAAAVSVQLPGNQELDMDADGPYDEAYAMELADFGGDSLMLAADWGNWGGNSGNSGVSTLLEDFTGFTSGVEYYLKHTCHHSNTASGDEYGYQVYLDVNPGINLNDKKTHIIVGPAVGDEITSGRPGENSTHTKWLYERNADGTWHISTTINGKRYYLALGEVDFGSYGVFVQDSPFAFTIGSGNYKNYGGSNEDHPGFIYSGQVSSTRGGTGTYDLYLDHSGNNKASYVFRSRTPTDGANEQLFDAERDVIPVVPPEPEPEEPTTYTLQVTKLKGTGASSLSGAQFALYSDANCTELVADLTPNDAGTIFTLPAGTTLELGKDYWLKETVTPAGYIPLAKPIKFSVDADGNATHDADKETLQNYSYDSNTTVLALGVANYTGIELPATGGTGLTHWYAIGAMLLFGAAALMYMNNKQRPYKNFEKEQ